MVTARVGSPAFRPMSETMNELLNRFPKARPALPPAIEAIYAAHYKRNREGATPASSLSRKMESWLHRQVAADLGSGLESGAGQGRTKTLEIGAGTLNQLLYEPDAGTYDIVEPFKELYEGSPLLARVRNVWADIREVPEQERYDRITSVATFEHLCNLPEVIARAGLLLEEDGVLRVSIPSEGTWLWTLGWKLTTGMEFRLKYGLDYGLLMRHEHVNDAWEIEALLRHFFGRVRSKVFGLSRRFSLYQFHACTLPHRQRCDEYLARLKTGASGDRDLMRAGSWIPRTRSPRRMRRGRLGWGQFAITRRCGCRFLHGRSPGVFPGRAPGRPGPVWPFAVRRPGRRYRRRPLVLGGSGCAPLPCC